MDQFRELYVSRDAPLVLPVESMEHLPLNAILRAVIKSAPPNALCQVSSG
jgi:hypothetical protein